MMSLVLALLSSIPSFAALSRQDGCQDAVEKKGIRQSGLVRGIGPVVTYDRGLKVSLDMLKMIANTGRMISLDEPLSDSNEKTIGSTYKNQWSPDPERILAQRQLRAFVIAAFEETLDEYGPRANKQLVKDVFYNGILQGDIDSENTDGKRRRLWLRKEIAESHGVSVERVRQIRNRIVEKMTVKFLAKKPIVDELLGLEKWAQ